MTRQKVRSTVCQQRDRIRARAKAAFAVCTVLLSLPASAAQFVEINAIIDVTSWNYHEETGLPLKSTRSYPVRCVAGTNTWLIENQSRTNVVESTWFLKGKLIRLMSYISEPTSEGTTLRTFRRGYRPTASIIPAPSGYPGADLPVNVPWFAFCSGTFLKQSARGAPVPTSAPDRAAFGFTNETTFFLDSFRLPKRAAFYATPRQLKCLYEVQQSTNVSGWNFPTAFAITHNEPDRFGKWNRELVVTGRVTSIAPVSNFAAPEELLELLDQPQVRRRQGSFPSIE